MENTKNIELPLVKGGMKHAYAITGSYYTVLLHPGLAIVGIPCPNKIKTIMMANYSMIQRPHPLYLTRYFLSYSSLYSYNHFYLSVSLASLSTSLSQPPTTHKSMWCVCVGWTMAGRKYAGKRSPEVIISSLPDEPRVTPPGLFTLPPVQKESERGWVSEREKNKERRMGKGERDCN